MRDFSDIEARKLLECARPYSPGGEKQQEMNGGLVEVNHDDFLRIIGRDPATTSKEEGMKLAREYNGLRQFEDYAQFNFSAPKPNPIFYAEALKFCVPTQEVEGGGKVVSMQEHIEGKNTSSAAIGG